MDLLNDTQAAQALLHGHVGVIPTDTLYGLVARATDAQAVTQMYRIKHRERKPGTVIAASSEQLLKLGLSEKAIRAVEHLWPGPLSIILTPEADTLPHLHQGLGDFPIRIPADERLRALLQQTGPLATTSANMPGEPSANTVYEAHGYFKDSVHFYVDGGDLSGRLPSTIARVTDSGVEVLRQGAFIVPPTPRA